MSFELPNLDTASAGEIQSQLVRRIPQFTRHWTDFNASDPGITLLQMLSWLGESLAYQANAIPIETGTNFLRWVLGLPSSTAPWPYAQAAAKQYDAAFLDLRDMLAAIERGRRPSVEELQAAVLGYLTSPYLAVTLADVEALAFQANGMIDAQEAHKPHAHVALARAVVAGEATVLHILPDAGAAYTRPAAGNFDRPGAPCQVTVLLQPDPNAARMLNELIHAVETYVAPRTLLGSAVRVRPARLTDINVSARIRCPAGVNPAVVLEAVVASLMAYFSAADGGIDGSGWRYGDAPDRQEVLGLITGAPGVAGIDEFELDYGPSIRLGEEAQLGIDTLLAALPLGTPAMTYEGLPRLRSLLLSAARDGS
jgi:hypothetical protein